MTDETIKVEGIASEEAVMTEAEKTAHEAKLAKEKACKVEGE